MSKGFSLIETITTMALISILAAIGIPSFSQFVERQRLSSDINSVIRLVNLARTESIKSKINTTVCGDSNQGTCSNNWRKLLVKTKKESTSTYSFKLSGNYKSAIWSSFQRKPGLTFNSLGFTTHLNGSLYLCHEKFPELHRAIRFSKSGKASIINTPNLLSQRCN